MVPATPAPFACFGKSKDPQKHYRAAEELQRAGVWIGYLANESHGKPYQDMPSFSELRMNCKHISPPYPQPIAGIAQEERHAICRGCYGDRSCLITLREISFTSRHLPNDRSLYGLQAYRPYEIGDGTQSKTFSNNFVLLALRNASQVTGTLETIRAALSPVQANDVSPKKRMKDTPRRLNAGSKANSVEKPGTHVLWNSTDTGNLISPARVQTRQMRRDTGPSDLDEARLAELTVSSSPKAVSKRAMQPPLNKTTLKAPAPSTKRKAPSVANETEPVAKRQQSAKASAPRRQQPTPASRDMSEDTIANDGLSSHDSSFPDHRGRSVSSSVPRVPPVPNKIPIIPPDLTEDQSERVRIICVIIADDIEFEFVHTLGECKTFSELLRLFREDAEQDPEATSILNETKLWRMSYQLLGGVKKAFTMRPGNEIAFERLRESLAQSPVWSEDSQTRVDVELRALI
ncbi:uncharacterized protein BDR25DRAFT_387347 [Lindgomyces ingoldianus]|uniref:Uncharacterized protein n=1 Tax=Lindgomyces ingoldianus TaxID=673940 RepID=A0ACB6R254_9PLEO|nr:uncharacterized protein BDR25DRAFT_387347 [Lindgomyces ingoldianus]KAF2473175.1 hypothetical protein BDR25DRAFT_387347 [Lindgomyces ingoldianus]